MKIFLAVEQSDAQLELELRKADVVCVVYAVDDEGGFQLLDLIITELKSDMTR